MNNLDRKKKERIVKRKREEKLLLSFNFFANSLPIKKKNKNKMGKYHGEIFIRNSTTARSEQSFRISSMEAGSNGERGRGVLHPARIFTLERHKFPSSPERPFLSRVSEETGGIEIRTSLVEFSAEL